MKSVMILINKIKLLMLMLNSRVTQEGHIVLSKKLLQNSEIANELIGVY